MKKSLFKPIIGGILIGSVLFALPFFVLRVAVFFMIGGALFRVFARRRMKGLGFGPNFADKIRAMSDEEYAGFKAKFQGRCAGRRNSEADQAKMMI